MRKIAIVGSREWADVGAIEDFIIDLPVCEVVSGGARGVDSIAAELAKKYEHEVKVFPADWDRHGKRAGFLRNVEIVDYCDELVAFWDGASKGTAHSISLARKANKPVTIFNSKTGVVTIHQKFGEEGDD